MEARSVRVAGLAVLLSALALGLPASAVPTPQVRLEISRLFDPNSESLLGALAGEIHGMSYLAQSVFNLEPSSQFVDRELADLLAPSQPASAADVNLPGVSPVKTYVPDLRASVVPAPELAAPSDGALSVAVSATPASAEVQPAGAPVPIAPVWFGSYSSFTPAAQSLGAEVNVPMRVGKVHFNEVMAGSQQQSLQSDAFRAMQVCGTTDQNAACPYLHDTSAQSFVAATDFNVRAWNSNVNLQLSSTVSHLSLGDSAIFQYVPADPDAQLNDNAFGPAAPGSSIVQYPGLADVTKTGVDARLAVPVNSRITLGLQYDRAHYQGDYLNTVLPDVDAYKNTYLGNLSYQIPNTNSIVTLSARQYRYQDTFDPNFNLTQTRADLNFTVKF